MSTTRVKKRKKSQEKEEEIEEEKGPIKEIPKPLTIPENHQKFINASGVYAKYIKGTEFETDANYEVTRVYFDFNHFDKVYCCF